MEIRQYKDGSGEIIFSDEEKEMGDKIITQHTDGEFGSLLISDRYDYSMDKLIIDKLDSSLKYFYWTERPIEQTSFDFIDKALDMRNMSIRMQLYIRTKTKLNVAGYQNGLTHTVARYTKNYQLQRDFPIGSNCIKGETYFS